MDLRHSDANASIPPNPRPPGEGFLDFDRFARTSKIRDGGIARARRLRSVPTHAETKLWKHLRQFDIRFRRQAPIGPYVVDFACHRAKLVIEVDGGVHDLTDVALRDLKRDDWLMTQGYRVLRIANERVENDIDAVVAEIGKAVGVSVPSTPAPFPLEGGRVGDGGGGTQPESSLQHPVSPEQDRVNPHHLQHPASTPSQPFPLEGKGPSEI